MSIKTLNIKIDEKLDRMLKLITSLGDEEDKSTILKNIIVEDAIPNLFSDPKQSAAFLKGLISFLKDKAYDTPSKYYISLALEDELTPFKQIVEVYVKIFPKEKETFDAMTDEVLVVAILDLCEYMYSKHIKDIQSQAITPTRH
jgi:hypothetical protein